jgi:hypothetical protein
LTADGHQLIGRRARELTATQSWQSGVVEGPSMIAVGDLYYLFYGANHWDTGSAAIGYAVCRSPLGPCQNQSTQGPWLGTSGPIVGPSGPTVFVGSDGGYDIAFHAWSGAPGYPGRRRELFIEPLSFANGAPVAV